MPKVICVWYLSDGRLIYGNMVVGGVRDVCVSHGKIYLLFADRASCCNDSGEIFSFPTLSRNCERICVGDRIYISDDDSGTLFTYAPDGKIISGEKMGEHIGDISLSSDLFAVTYHDNKLIRHGKKETTLEFTPQTVIADENVYILMNDGFYTYIEMRNTELEMLRRIKMPRQIGELRRFGNKTVFGGNEFYYIFDFKLKNPIIKKGTGSLLCRASSEPVLETGEKVDIMCGAVIRRV